MIFVLVRTGHLIGRPVIAQRRDTFDGWGRLRRRWRRNGETFERMALIQLTLDRIHSSGGQRRRLARSGSHYGGRRRRRINQTGAAVVAAGIGAVGRIVRRLAADIHRDVSPAQRHRIAGRCDAVIQRTRGAHHWVHGSAVAVLVQTSVGDGRGCGYSCIRKPMGTS